MWMFACMYACESHACLAPMEPPEHALLKLAEWTATSILCFVLCDPLQRGCGVQPGNLFHERV